MAFTSGNWMMHVVLMIPNVVVFLFMQDMFTAADVGRMLASSGPALLQGKSGCNGNSAMQNMKTAASTAASASLTSAGLAATLPTVSAQTIVGVNAIPRRNQGPKFLDDNTFEHLTQAATGATTGDWLVYFYSAAKCELDSKCKLIVEFLRFQQPLVKEWCIVAFVNIDDNPFLAERFGFPDTLLPTRNDHQLPKLVFFRQGRMFEVENSLKPIIQDYKKFRNSPDGKNPDPSSEIEWDENEMYKIHLGLDPEKDPLPLVKYLMARQYGRVSPANFVPPPIGFFQYFSVKVLQYKAYTMPEVTYPILNGLGHKYEATREHKSEL